MAGPPLSLLLSRVLVPLVWELDAESPGSLAVWADLLRVLPADGVSQRGLLALAHVSPRSMHVLATAAERQGLVTSTTAAKIGPFLRPTAAATGCCRAWEARLAAIEQRWRADHGTDGLRTALQNVVDAIELELPWLLLPYGPSDNTASVGPPVPRTSVDRLPLFALLSQLLAAVTLAYEAQHGWMLSMMMTAFDGFPDEGMPIADVHPFADVRGNGKTLHERHGIVTVENVAGQPKQRIARLTRKGRDFRDRHRPTIDAVEAALSAHVGDEKLNEVRRRLIDVARSLPDASVRHLCMAYQSGPKWVEVSPRV